MGTAERRKDSGGAKQLEMRCLSEKAYGLSSLYSLSSVFFIPV